jgi:hypothetical protein
VLTARVTNGGNLRSEPRIVPETVLAQVCPGDEVVVLEQQQVDTVLWYHIRVVTRAPDCVANHAAQDTTGWLSTTLLSTPAPVPAPVAEAPTAEVPAPTAASTPPDARNGVILKRTRMRESPGGPSHGALPQACPADTVTILEQQGDGAAAWMHIRITETGDACTDQRAPTGTEGWVKAMQVEEVFDIPAMIIGEWQAEDDPTFYFYFYDTGAMYMRSTQSERVLTADYTFVDADSIDLDVHVSSFASGIFDIAIKDSGNEMHMITPEGDRRVLHKMGPPPPLIDSGIGPIPPPPNSSEPAP